ncbi:MAG: hypothetical protein GTO45_26970 [Candidatus Aminicenantes bacterium]|nr:hypothetical protein [Candidatus Aminicenantes bacterium]NIM82426.1 hypothetical protein [Candidatus Aminicenantes bacterium]NIN21787.1 hypothetical protein [Candidatus Aminicenantes bacterium]NIN45579.1 hypothetical protein [Candidatus Aminicenantes bacterium]NIN88410.1 hypothetical protein [Candidatus Aminicenantes bacterium]
MDYALKERIGKPELFTGRKEELSYFLKWIDDIKEEKSQSTAILARRKMGKTALMERLFNITFFKNDGVIPFYYEIKENDVWIVDFCTDFFFTFIYHYIAFKTRKIEYLMPVEESNFEKVKQVSQEEGFPDLTALIESVEHAARNEYVDTLWKIVRNAPKTIATRQKEFIVQMIDEFQFINVMIYRDKEMKILAKNLAGGYLSTAESKIAPLLVSGSWVGWLMNELNMMLPARFKYKSLKNMTEPEAVELVFKYSRFFQVPVTEETAYLLVELSEGNPFYMSAVIRSEGPDKDLTTIDGLTRTLEFETLEDQGVIKSTWMEYIARAFPQINDQHSKNLVLHLSKHRDRELTRKELLDELELEMTDGELEKKLKALVKADIIKQGTSNYRYRGVNDNIFDKVFRGVYQEEIREFDASMIKKEYKEELKKMKKQYKKLLGKYHYQKGYFAEYLILNQLKLHARKNNDYLKSITRYLPDDFDFCDYSRVWKYHSSPEYTRAFSVDIFARAENPGDYSIIGEVKSREVKKFSKDEVMEFEKKFAEVKKLENIDRAVGFIFSRSGFTTNAQDYCKEKGIACSEDERWLESVKLKSPLV